MTAHRRSAARPLCPEGSLCVSEIAPCDRDAIPEDHPVRVFDDFWHGLPRQRLPHRDALTPAAIPSLLKWLMILEQGGTTEHPTFVVRLQGTAVQALSAGNLTGRELAAFTEGDAYRSRLALFRDVIAAAAPRYGRATLISPSNAKIPTSVGVFPFCTNDPARHHLVIIAGPDDAALRAAL
ncbi:MAG: PAS domain-containing protein [Alphaproteobacteria bacterium]|nr:MAG: PAS domain-containing protein [Alphaproteobacteria bacterium]